VARLGADFLRRNRGGSMSRFPADWLSLREPHDQRARNRAVQDAVVDSLVGYASVSIVDLACGTGSTLRALAPHIVARQKWLLADNDLSLLARAADTPRPYDALVTTAPIDLARDLEAALDGPVDLVTASALLDLVSDEWLERLAIECAVRSAPFYAALTYNGRMAFDPADDCDTDMIAAVNAHQLTDKGFGPALGSEAPRTLIARFERLDYHVHQGAADWQCGPADKEIQMEICNGCASAARETGRLSLVDIMAWLTRRRDAIAAGRSRIRIGHLDVFAQPKSGTRFSDRSQSSSISSSSWNIRSGTRKA
jgi:hypothetical protein